MRTIEALGRRYRGWTRSVFTIALRWTGSGRPFQKQRFASSRTVETNPPAESRDVGMKQIRSRHWLPRVSP